MIQSRKNSRLKDIRRLRRCKGAEAILEGPHLIGEALDAGLALRSTLATPGFLATPAGRRLAQRLPEAPLEVEGKLLDELADSDSPRGVVAITRLPRGGAEGLPAVAAGVYLYVEAVQDPGNLGALARVAEASGAAGMALSAGCAHPNHPRALRASAGSLLRLPVTLATSAAELDERLEPLAPRWVALVPRGGRDLYREELVGCLVVAIGAEGPGLSGRIRQRCELRVTIPVEAPVESLNTAVAAAVVLFELRRRRLG